MFERKRNCLAKRIESKIEETSPIEKFTKKMRSKSLLVSKWFTLMEKKVSKLIKIMSVTMDTKTITPTKKNVIVEMRVLIREVLISPLISFVKAVFNPRFER